MKLLRNLTTALSPRRNQFAKRLGRKRRLIAEEKLFASLSVGGTIQDFLRRNGLEAIDHIFSPDAVVANAMEIYRFSHLQGHYGSLSENTRLTMSAKEPMKWSERLNSFVALIDMHLTGRGDAADNLPEFCTFPEYLMFAVKRAFPKHSYITVKHGFTDEYFNYAIDESGLVYG